MSKNFYLDPDTNDLVLSNYNLRLTTSQTEFIAQKLTNKLLLFLGEWFLDTTRGIPYFDSILKKNPDINEVNSIFLIAISEEDEIEEVLKFEVDFNSTERNYIIDFEVLASGGETVAGSISV